MATEGISIAEDTEMAECDGDKIVTMMDVLQEQQDFEEDANAVLGASDDKECTYAKGYIKRQAIYACMTCCPDAKTDPTKRAGVCLACSLNCHENHELVELYTKRNFRCDCGNPKFNSHPCQFTPTKTDVNSDNLYNQNFSGLYCTCQRPYPDLETNFEDEMIQCIICEDWLHASHLDAIVPASDPYTEMICKGCMEKNEFLHDYSNLAVNVEVVDVITVNGNHVADTGLCNGDVSTAKNEGVVPNGCDVEMADSNEKTDGNKSEIEASTDIADTEKEQVSDSAPAEKTTDDSKEDAESATTIENTENEETHNTKDSEIQEQISLDAEQNKDTSIDDTIKNAEDEANKISNASQEQNVDKSDTNKIEDQLIDDIKALTSEKMAEEEKTEDKLDNSTENLEKPENSVTSGESIEKMENAPLEQTNELVGSPGAKSSLEGSNTEVPDTSQETSEKTNVDDKTDDVMDAINAFLEASTETKGSESEKSIEKVNEQGGETQEPNDVNLTDSEAKQIDDLPEKSESSTTDNNEKTDTDVDMAENRIYNEAAVVTEEKESENVDTENKSVDEAPKDIDEKSSTDTDKVENDDLSKESEVGNTDKMVSDDKSETEYAAVEDKASNSSEYKRKLSVTEESSPKKVKFDISKCRRPKGVHKVFKGATFWPENFRQKLCTCGACISMYKDLHVLFLIDSEDTVSYYENLGKDNADGGVSQYEKGLQALSSLDRIQQINALTEYNKMRDKLLDFLKSFKDRQVIVKEEDIKAFFAGMKPKREPDGVYFCR